MHKRVLTVSILTEYLKCLVENEDILKNISVRGEISGLSFNNKTAYFFLKDSDSQIQCVYFNCTDKTLADGARVIASGTPSIYTKTGKLSFNVKSIEQDGKGDIFLAILKLKERLEAEGLFLKKLPMPKVINRIGVVTSETGAVIHDIISVARRRNPCLDIVLYPVKVQGLGAEKEITAAVRTLESYDAVDAIIVARGGGSFEDLMPFNTEEVARAVASCKKFVVSAVGHETDVTLCDAAADVRAATPSIAAEILAIDLQAQKHNLIVFTSSINTCFERKMYDHGENLKNAVLRLHSSVYRLSDSASGRVRGYITRIKAALERRISVENHRLKALVKAVGARDIVKNSEQKLREMYRQLSVTPQAISKFGYVKLLAGGVPVAGAGQLERGQKVTARLSDGSAEMTVDRVDKVMEVNL